MLLWSISNLLKWHSIVLWDDQKSPEYIKLFNCCFTTFGLNRSIFQNKTIVSIGASSIVGSHAVLTWFLCILFLIRGKNLYLSHSSIYYFCIWRGVSKNANCIFRKLFLFWGLWTSVLVAGPTWMSHCQNVTNLIMLSSWQCIPPTWFHYYQALEFIFGVCTKLLTSVVRFFDLLTWEGTSLSFMRCLQFLTIHSVTWCFF